MVDIPPPSFGIELEFFLLDADDFPALGATTRVIERWHRRGYDRPPVPELSSFQIELNPGPWPLTPAGLEASLAELEELVRRLEECASFEGVALSTAALIPKVTKRYLLAEDYFTADPKLLASSRHFKNSRAIIEFQDGTALEFPGETVVGCINEVHIHVRQHSDEHTLRYYNYLNRVQNALWTEFKTPLTLNGKPVKPHCDTLHLFNQANCEMNAAGDLCRIGYLPIEIQSFDQYLRLASSFAPIITDSITGSTMPSERALWFWVRLQGAPGSLRVEYRPTEMGTNWSARVRRLFADAYRFSLSDGQEDGSAVYRSQTAEGSLHSTLP